MNFLGVGPAELIVILVVALIFVGPERLPKLAADLARTIREIRKYTGSLAAEFNEVIEDFSKDTADDRNQWKEIGQGLTAATQSVTQAFREARSDAEGAPTSAPPHPDASTEPEGVSADTPPRDAWLPIEEPTSPATSNGVRPDTEPAPSEIR